MDWQVLTRELSLYLESQVRVGLFGSGVGLSLVLGFGVAYACYYLSSIAKVSRRAGGHPPGDSGGGSPRAGSGGSSNGGRRRRRARRGSARSPHRVLVEGSALPSRAEPGVGPSGERDEAFPSPGRGRGEGKGIGRGEGAPPPAVAGWGPSGCCCRVARAVVPPGHLLRSGFTRR